MIIGKNKARTFNLSSTEDTKAYEAILNDTACNLYEKKEYMDRDGDIIMYVEYIDQKKREEDEE